MTETETDPYLLAIKTLSDKVEALAQQLVAQKNLLDMIAEKLGVKTEA